MLHHVPSNRCTLRGLPMGFLVWDLMYCHPAVLALQALNYTCSFSCMCVYILPVAMASLGTSLVTSLNSLLMTSAWHRICTHTLHLWGLHCCCCLQSTLHYLAHFKNVGSLPQCKVCFNSKESHRFPC